MPFALVLIAALLPLPSEMPIGPLRRGAARTHELTFRDEILGGTPRAEAVLEVPFVIDHPFVVADVAGFRSAVSQPGRPAGAVIPLREHVGNTAEVDLSGAPATAVTVTTRYRVRVFSSVLDEAGAASIPWPRTWPGDVEPFLEPSYGIESDRASFATIVERVTEGRARLVQPYIVAKALIGHSVRGFRWEYEKVADHGSRAGHFDRRRRVEYLRGATIAAAQRSGSPADLVALCVATLRAAEIPARLVTGVTEEVTDRDLREGKPRLKKVVWGEFYLPDCGWIPFDPEAMRSAASAHRPIDQPWPGLGTVDLRHRVPMWLEPSRMPWRQELSGAISVRGSANARRTVRMNTVATGSR